MFDEEETVNPVTATTTEDRADPGSAALFLARELTRIRLESGISLRRLARLFGMSAHSGLVDYERGNRIPPANIMLAYGRVFAADRDYVARLYRAAMVERAADTLANRFRKMQESPAGG